MLLAACAVLLPGSSASVFDRDEARFALAVREMREQGELFVPSNWGVPRYHKPILAYWCAMASERFFGAGERALRFPSLVAGLAAVAATIAMVRRRLGERVALRAGAILATTFLFVLEAKILTADALLLGTTTLAFWAWMEWSGARRPATGWRLLFWVALALGLLAKGVNVLFLAAAAGARIHLRLAREGRAPRTLPLLFLVAALAAAVPRVAVLGPILCAAGFAWIFWLGRTGWRDAWRASGAVWGLPLCVALVSIWLVPALVASHGDFLREGVGHHLLGRATRVFEGHAGFPGYYLVTGVLFLFPWAALLPSALRRTWRDPRAELFLAWIVGPWIVLESSASKLPHYVLVTLPAVAVLVASELEHREATGRGWRGALERALFSLPVLMLLAGGLALAWRGPPETRTAALGIAMLAGLLGVAGHVLGARHPRFLFPLLAGGALALYAWVGAVALPAIEPLRLAPRLGRELTRLALPGEALHLYRWAPASVGVYLPKDHPLVVERSTVIPDRSGLVVVENTRLEAFLTSHPGSWQRLGSLQGIGFLGPSEVVILRNESNRR